MDDAPPQLDGRAYLDLGREAFELVNRELINFWDSVGVISPTDIPIIMGKLYGEQGDTTIATCLEGKRGTVQAAIETQLNRRGSPTSPESRELLERDAAQDALNRRTGLTTRLIELESQRDARMTSKDWDIWRRRLNAVEAELDRLPAAEADAIRGEARRSLDGMRGAA